MMFFTEPLIAFIIAVFFSIMLVFALGWERPDRKGAFPAIIYLFMIIFFFTWAGGIWFAPFGPRLWNVQWLPFFIIGFIITLMLITLIPPAKRKPRTKTDIAKSNRDAKMNRETVQALNVYFWILWIILIILIIVRYFILKPVL